MKTRAQLSILLAILMATSIGHAAWTEGAALHDDSSAWTQMKRKVESVWSGITQYWKSEESPKDKGTDQDDSQTEIAKQKPSIPKEPEFQVDNRIQDLKKMKAAASAQSGLAVAKPGMAADPALGRTRTGVPVVNWKRFSSKRIPRLNVGREDQITRRDFALSKVGWSLRPTSKPERLKSPAMMDAKSLKTVLSQKITRSGSMRSLEGKIRSVGKPLALETVKAVQFKIAETRENKPLPYSPLSEEEMKMVAALILFAQGNHCHMIMGLFQQLAEAPKTRTEAMYHLGACADQLQMHQSAFDVLGQVITGKDKEFAPLALEQLGEGLPTVYEEAFYKKLKDWEWEKLLTDKSRDNTYYRMAKGAYKMGHYNRANQFATSVSDGYKYHDDAVILTAMSAFARKEKKTALNILEGLWKSLESRKVSDSNLRALVSVNLARMYFANKRFDAALEHYMKVPKDHPLWVEALIEQGWTQLATEDFSGAIGNMYSLHSPYFKAVYQPESFAVRTIGYLSICQYGDAYKTLSWLERDYRKWGNQLNQYMGQKPSPDQIYSTVTQYIRGKSTNDLQGVAYQIWRELARRKDYLNSQVALNEKADETKRYEGVNGKIKEEKAGIRDRASAAKRRFDQWRGQLIKVKENKKIAKTEVQNIHQGLQLERERTMGYRFKLALLEQSRQGYLTYQKISQAKIDSEAGRMRKETGQNLLARAKQVQREMNKILENNEFLRYEVFSGSGENIRYQVAGGNVGAPNRIPASIKPMKMMNWSFDGEFWEDEIGSYRSSLQNNCPNQPHETADLGRKQE